MTTVVTAERAWSGRALRLAQFREAVGDSQPERKGQAATLLVVRAGLVDGHEVVLGRHDPAQPDKTADLTLGEARQGVRRRSEWAGSRQGGPPDWWWVPASLSAGTDLLRTAAMRMDVSEAHLVYAMGLLTDCADTGASTEATTGGAQSLGRVAISSTRPPRLRFLPRRRLLDSAIP